MLNCRQVTRLLSRSMDAKLSWPQWLAMRVHLLYCVWCRRYADQVKFLRRAAAQLARASSAEPAQRLSAEAKEQMRARLQRAIKDSPPLWP